MNAKRTGAPPLSQTAKAVSLLWVTLPRWACAQTNESSPAIAQLPQDLSPWGMFLHADAIVKAVMIGLAVASLVRHGGPSRRGSARRHQTRPQRAYRIAATRRPIVEGRTRRAASEARNAATVTTANTMGMVEVSRFSAAVTGIESVRITSGCRLTSSFASVRIRSVFAGAQRTSIRVAAALPDA
jgi:hypothetical protein